MCVMRSVCPKLLAAPGRCKASGAATRSSSRCNKPAATAAVAARELPIHPKAERDSETHTTSAPVNNRSKKTQGELQS